MITSENIMVHELIGLDTKIVQSSQVRSVGIRGKVVDETKSMFILHTENGIKKFPKQNTLWTFSFGSVEITLDGNNLTKRPFERIGGKT
ncbi:MAG TPA: ribonuclease P protein subunit [Nitrosopumilaceae archaeon]|nr:ribonuclease P protein subunit [Nitrosopumilaceae archaeon]